MKKYQRSALLLMIGLVVFPACREQASNTTKLNTIQLRDNLQYLVNKHDLMGMAVAVIKDGALLWQSNHGFANIANQKAVDKNTLFRVASISKTVTAVAVLQLVEQGKLDLDTDVSNYLGWTLMHPKFPDTPITLRLLMSHRSGIRDGGGYGPFSRDMLVKQLGIKDLLSPEGSYYQEDMFGDSQPGELFLLFQLCLGLGRIHH